MTGPELYLLETRRDRTRGLTQLQGACRQYFFCLRPTVWQCTPSCMQWLEGSNDGRLVMGRSASDIP